MYTYIYIKYIYLCMKIKYVIVEILCGDERCA